MNYYNIFISLKNVVHISILCLLITTIKITAVKNQNRIFTCYKCFWFYFFNACLSLFTCALHKDNILVVKYLIQYIL